MGRREARAEGVRGVARWEGRGRGARGTAGELGRWLWPLAEERRGRSAGGRGPARSWRP